jgi:mycofactocin precursor
VALGAVSVGTECHYLGAEETRRQAAEAVMTEQAVLEQSVIEEQAQVTGPAAEPAGPAEDEALVADELLVEEVSIDGMCGVY